MLKVTITIEAHTTSDAAIAIEEAKEKVEQGYRSGFDSNDTGSYSFSVEGEEEEEEEENENED